MCLIGSVGRVGSEGLEDSGPPSSCKHQKQELGRAALRHILPSRPSLAYFSDGVTAVTGTGLDSPVRTRVIPITRFQQAGVREIRNPLLLFRLSGLLLLRLAERQLLSLLFHDPPRSSRSACPIFSAWKRPAH